MSFVTASDNLLDLNGVGQRQSFVAWEVLDQNLTLIGTVQPRESSPPSVAVDVSAKIMRTIGALRLTPTDLDAIDAFRDRLRPVWVLENGARYSLGVYVFASMDRLRFDNRLEAQAGCVDLAFILDQAIEQTFAMDTGADKRAALETLFAQSGMPSWSIDADVAGQQSAPVAWPAGTSRLDVMSQIAVDLGCFPVYTDNDGTARVRKVIPLSEETPVVTYASGGHLLNESMVESDNLLESPNRYLVIDSGNVDVPITAVFDIPDDAPNSAHNRGFTITKVISTQGLAGETEALAVARADYEATGGGFETVAFSSPPDPRHGVFSAISYLGNTYRELSWSLPLQEGSEMTHAAGRSYG